MHYMLAACSGFGCARGYKQDTLNTYLSDACQQGCQILTGEPTMGDVVSVWDLLGASGP